MKYLGKVAIVTGGVSGIGLATVKLLAENGATVVAADWSNSGRKVIDELNNLNVIFIKTDVSSENDIRSLFDTTVEKFGHVDYVVANAGIGSGKSCHEETIEGFNKVIGVNLTGVFLTCKYAIEYMLKQENGGSIVSTASILGLVGSPTSLTYCAAKGGVINMTRSMAVAYAKNNIRVNAVAPGFVDTPILSEVPKENLAAIAAAHPIGRLGKSIEIANVISFLLSDEASFITGVTVPVDGGYTAQ